MSQENRGREGNYVSFISCAHNYEGIGVGWGAMVRETKWGATVRDEQRESVVHRRQLQSAAQNEKEKKT